jgi:hypothetical protein
MREPPPIDRQRTMKDFMVWTLVLAVLFGSQALSFAEPKPIRPPGCQCACWYTDADGTVKKGVTFVPRPDEKSCTPLFIRGRGVPCKDKAGKEHLGTRWANCKFIGRITLPVAPGVQPPVAR